MGQAAGFDTGRVLGFSMGLTHLHSSCEGTSCKCISPKHVHKRRVDTQPTSDGGLRFLDPRFFTVMDKENFGQEQCHDPSHPLHFTACPFQKGSVLQPPAFSIPPPPHPSSRRTCSHPAGGAELAARAGSRGGAAGCGGRALGGVLQAPPGGRRGRCAAEPVPMKTQTSCLH